MEKEELRFGGRQREKISKRERGREGRKCSWVFFVLGINCPASIWYLYFADTSIRPLLLLFAHSRTVCIAFVTTSINRDVLRRYLVQVPV
jgi:hypothetical protein